jgi:hypothetical protein
LIASAPPSASAHASPPAAAALTTPATTPATAATSSTAISIAVAVAVAVTVAVGAIVLATGRLDAALGCHGRSIVCLPGRVACSGTGRWRWRRIFHGIGLLLCAVSGS